MPREAEASDASHVVQARDPMFNVVHDPLADRFVLLEIQDREEATSERVASVAPSTSPFPWDQIVLPHRCVSKCEAAPPCAATPSRSANPADPTRQYADPPSSLPTRRPRQGNRACRMTTLSTEMASLVLSLSERGDATEGDQGAIKWRGEPLSVRVVGLPAAELTSNNESDDDILDPRIAFRSTERSMEHDDGQWLARTYDLRELARIRPRADGFRDRSVNVGSVFKPMDPWLSDSHIEETEEEEEEEEEGSSSDESPLPIFQRGDRVLFRVSGSLRERSGRVAHRIRRSVFYDVRDSNGCEFKSVYAGNMALRPARGSKPRRKPRYQFAKHDKVLWLPPEDASADEGGSNDRHRNDQATFKARVVQVRSLDRFDLLLRTGRIVKRVPYDELRPRGSF